jgi:hypothetical protein
MDPEDEIDKAEEEYRLRDEVEEYNLRTFYEHQDEEEEKKRAEQERRRAEEERWRKEEEDHDSAQAESHLRDEEEKRKRAEKDISSRPPSIMDPEDEIDKAEEEYRLRDEVEEYNLRTFYEHQDEEEEKKRAEQERRRAEEERWRKEEEDHDSAQAESHLRDEQEKKRAEKDISSRPPSMCSCRKETAQFKLTIVQFRSGCTCTDPISHVGRASNVCSLKCSYWDVEERYTEGGVSFVVMGGMDECNVCGEPMMSTATYRLEELS